MRERLGHHDTLAVRGRLSVRGSSRMQGRYGRAKWWQIVQWGRVSTYYESRARFDRGKAELRRQLTIAQFRWLKQPPRHFECGTHYDYDSNEHVDGHKEGAAAARW